MTQEDVIENPLSQRAASLLRCPSCKGTLLIADRECVCSSCRIGYPIVKGVPVLIDEKKSAFQLSDVLLAGQVPAAGRQWKKILRRRLPTLEMNLTGRDNILRLKKKLLDINAHPLALNIGGKHAGSFSQIMGSGPDVECIEAHVALAPRTNLVTDPHALPLADESVDAVIIDAVLEHMIDPVAVVDEVFRVLKTGGLVYSDTPFMVQVHGGAFDFMRFSHLAHRRLFRKFSEVESGISVGPGSALAVSAQAFLLSFVRSSNARAIVKGLCCLSLFWLKYFDHFLLNRKGSLDAALGTFFVGQKGTQTLSDRDLIRQYRGNSPHLYPTPPAARSP